MRIFIYSVGVYVYTYTMECYSAVTPDILTRERMKLLPGPWVDFPDEKTATSRVDVGFPTTKSEEQPGCAVHLLPLFPTNMRQYKETALDPS